MITQALIPTNGIHITENFHPRGYLVARYDTEGFTSDRRYFSTLEKAQAYAATLAGMRVA